ncbi:MAG: hypothetical protein IKU87_00505 [Clostridia bacterium]|nr:hypothetical protein [Clostridia bacterium]
MGIKHKLIYIFTLVTLFIIILNATSSIDAAKDALILCAETVIPSLFPFFVISSFMINTGLVRAVGLVLAPLSKRIFRVSGSGAVAFAMGILSGYPTGAKMVTEIYEAKIIGKNEATRLIPFCNNSGPLFVIGAVGIGMLGSFQAGVMLYVVHIISAVIVGILFSYFSKGTYFKDEQTVMATNLGRAFSDSVGKSVETILRVCGYIIFFAVLRNLALPLVFNVFGKGEMGLFVSSLIEVTLGAKDLTISGLPFDKLLILLSGAIGFGGICVLIQVMGIISSSELSVKSYITGKIIQGAVSMLITWQIMYFYKPQPTFNSISEITHRYILVSPLMLIAFFLACAYSTVRKKR